MVRYKPFYWLDELWHFGAYEYGDKKRSAEMSCYGYDAQGTRKIITAITCATQYLITYNKRGPGLSVSFTIPM